PVISLDSKTEISQNTETSELLASGMKIPTIVDCIELLIQNAISLSASEIKLAIDFEKLFLQISDNGLGLSYDQLVNLGLHQSTHLPGTRDDLDNGDFQRVLKNLSFIFQVGNTLIKSTKHGTAQTFQTSFNNDNSKLPVNQTNYQSPGTTIYLSNWFQKFPVRKKLLESKTKNIKSSVVRLIEKYSLINHKICFTLKDLGLNKSLVNARPTQDLKSKICRIFGYQLSNKLDFVYHEYENSSLNGCISINKYLFESKKIIKFVNNIVLNSGYDE
ncbi:hypothetical protein BB560_006514, partial [Smittium megazygosporum]